MSESEQSHELLMGNRMPTEEERQTSQQIISSAEDDLRVLLHKMSELRAQLQVLEREETDLLEVVSRHQLILSPFRRLPEDIIRIIFLSCLNTTHNPSMSNKNAPMLLTQISGGLRRIALQTPELWTAIHIAIVRCEHDNLLGRATSIMDKRVQGVNQWFERSGNLPLSISVFDCQKYKFTETLAQGVIDAILKSSRRWRDVTFDSAFTVLTNKITGGVLSHTQVPLLQSIVFRTTSAFKDLSHCKIFYGPSIRKILLGGRGTQDILKSDSIHWRNLTDLVLLVSEVLILHDYVFGSLAAVLRQTRNLIRFTTDIDVFHTFQTGDTTTEIRLPCLKTLGLAGPEARRNPFSDQGLLALINAPSLQGISVSNVERSRPALLTFLQQNVSLREFHCTYSELYCILDCVRCCSSLKVLHLHLPFAVVQDNFDSFLRALAAETSNLEYFFCSCNAVVSAVTLRNFVFGKKAVILRLCKVPGTEEAFNNIILEAERNGTKVILQDLDEDPFSGHLTSGILPDPSWWWPTSMKPIYCSAEIPWDIRRLTRDNPSILERFSL